MQPPVPYSPTLEHVRDDELETIARLEAHFAEIMDATHAHSGHAMRGVHAKSHGVLSGELRVHGGLAPELAQGLFARSGRHEAVLRLSTNAGDILPDTIPLPRGLALKVLDVPGERLAGAAGSAQDFILLNASAFPAADARAFEGNLALLAKTTDRVEWLKKVAARTFGAVNAAREAVGLDPSPKLASLGGVPNLQPLGETYHSVTPFRFGAYVAKFRLVPQAPWMQALAGEEVEVDGRENAVREAVRGQMQDRDARWLMQAQLLRDPEAQPLEDASAEWLEEVSPFETIATLSVPAQDSWDPGRVEQATEHLRFSVWTGIEAHRPLGNINRARNTPYRFSAAFRERANGCPIHEPGRSAPPRPGLAPEKRRLS